MCVSVYRYVHMHVLVASSVLAWDRLKMALFGKTVVKNRNSNTVIKIVPGGAVKQFYFLHNIIFIIPALKISRTSPPTVVHIEVQSVLYTSDLYPETKQRWKGNFLCSSVCNKCNMHGSF